MLEALAAKRGITVEEQCVLLAPKMAKKLKRDYPTED